MRLPACTAALSILCAACVINLDGLATGGSGGAGPHDAGADADAGCPVLDCSCASDPTVLAEGAMFASLPRGIAVNNDGVYWANLQGGSVVRVAASGGGPDQLVVATSPRGVAVSSGTLVWTADDGVYACTLSSCAKSAHKVAPSAAPGSLSAVAFDGHTLAFTDHGSGLDQGKARSCAVDACTPLDLGGNMHAPAGIALSGSLAFWADQGNGNQNGTVSFSPKDAPALTQVSASLDLPTGVAADDTYVYWTEQAPGGHVYRCAFAAGYCDMPEDIAPSAGALGRPSDIVVAGGRVYWTNMDDGSIMSCPQPGCGTAKPTAHVTGRSGISHLAVGTSCLFWTEDGGGGAVLKAAR